MTKQANTMFQLLALCLLLGSSLSCSLYQSAARKCLEKDGCFEPVRERVKDAQTKLAAEEHCRQLESSDLPELTSQQTRWLEEPYPTTYVHKGISNQSEENLSEYVAEYVAEYIAEYITYVGEIEVSAADSTDNETHLTCVFSFDSEEQQVQQEEETLLKALSYLEVLK